MPMNGSPDYFPRNASLKLRNGKAGKSEKKQNITKISLHCFHSKAPNPFPEMVSLRRTALMRCTMISNSEGTVRATAMGRSAQSPTARRRQPPICSKKRRRAKGVSCCKPRNKAVNSLFRNTAKAGGNLQNFQKFDCAW